MSEWKEGPPTKPGRYAIVYPKNHSNFEDLNGWSAILPHDFYPQNFTDPDWEQWREDYLKPILQHYCIVPFPPGE